MQRIREKLQMECGEIASKDPITIVAFGDSVTHGWMRQNVDYENVYWNRLRRKINAVRDVVPVNVINAGIGGITAKGSLQRMQRQVLDHHPDLIIVCFGLNDVNGTLEDYLSSLRIIFEKRPGERGGGYFHDAQYAQYLCGRRYGQASGGLCRKYSPDAMRRKNGCLYAGGCKACKEYGNRSL